MQTRKELVSDEGNSLWAILVEYLESQGKGDSDRQAKGKVDYREVLSPADFSLYSKLRDARKKLAEEGGLPVYAVCTSLQKSPSAWGCLVPRPWQPQKLPFSPYLQARA